MKGREGKGKKGREGREGKGRLGNGMELYTDNLGTVYIHFNDIVCSRFF